MKNAISLHRKAYGKNYKYLILISLCLVAFISVFCQYQMQPMAEKIKSIFHLTDSQYSALFTAPMTPAIFISLICGIIVDKFGGRWPMFISLLIGSIGLWGRVFATSYGMLYICIFVVGFAATFGNSSNAKMFSEWFTASECSICIGIYMASSSMGSAVATITTPHIATLKGAYTISAVVITVVTIVWYIFYRDNATGDTSGASNIFNDSKEGFFTTIKIIFKQKDMLLLCLGDMFLYGAHQSLSTFLVFVMASKGVDAAKTGMISAVTSAGMFAGNLILPQIVARLGNIKRPVVIFTLLGTCIFFLVAYIPAGILMILFLLLEGIFIGGSIPVLMAMPLNMSQIGSSRVGTAGGLIATFQLLGSVVLPTYVVSRLAGGNYYHLVIISAVFSFIGVLLLACLSKNVEVSQG